jgi:hypothetical protein
MSRCPLCGERLFSSLSIGEQYRCGTVVSSTQQAQHDYCRRLCGEAAYAKAKRPRMIREARDLPRYDGKSGRWASVRDAILAMTPGQTRYFEDCDRSAANRAMHLISYQIEHKVLFRHDRGCGRGCMVSMIGNVDGMQPGESRLYSDSLRHTVTRLKTLNEDALRGRENAGVYTMDLIDGIYWIRRLL